MKKIFTVALLCCLLLYCFSPTVFANAPGPNMDGTYDPNPAMLVIMIGAFVVICLLLTAFTCVVELKIARLFGLHIVYKKTILVTNLITQVIMHILEFLSICFVSQYVASVLHQYLITVLVLEVLVYISEFLIYCKKMAGVSRKRILLYTVCANTASLLGGLLLTFFII